MEHLEQLDHLVSDLSKWAFENLHLLIPSAVVGTTLYVVYSWWPRAPKGLEYLVQVPVTKATRILTDVNNPFDVKYWSVRSAVPSDARRLYIMHLGFKSVVYLGASEAAKTFYDQSNFKKPDGLGLKFFGIPGFLAYYLGENIAVVNDPDWSRHRVVVKPAFSRPLRTAPFVESGSLLVKTFHAMASKGSIDFYSWMQRLTLDVLGRGIFSFDFLSLHDPEDPGKYVKSWNSMMSRIFHPLYAIFPFLCYLPTPWVSETWRLLKNFRGLLDNMILERKAELDAGRRKDEKQQDLLDMMIEASENEKDFSMADVVSNINVFFLAGHDTTAHTLSLAVYLMALHKDVQEKAREEVFSILGKPTSFEDAVSSGPENNQVGKLQYINAIIKETLRMYPSVPSIPNRTAIKDVPISFKDVNGTQRSIIIPKGSVTSVDVYGMHYDPQYYENPKKFMPERWLSEKSDSEGLKPWMPFGGGARICLGMQFSLMEQKVTLAMLLRNFELDLPLRADGMPEEVVLGSSGLMRPVGLKIFLKPIVSK